MTKVHRRNGGMRIRTQPDGERALASRSRGPLSRMLTFRRLEVAAVLLPLALLGFYYYLMLGPLHHFFHEWVGFVVLWAALAFPIWLFARTVFGVVGAMQEEIAGLQRETEQLNERLVALHRVNAALSRETRYDEALKRIAGLARELTGAPLALVSVATGHEEERQIIQAPTGEGDERALPEALVDVLDRCRGSSLRIGRLSESEDGLPAWLKPGSAVCAPLRYMGSERCR